jgi:hypothetical protein
MPSRGLTDFFGLLTNLKRLIGAAAAAATPLAAYTTGVAPPWPERAPIITTVVALVFVVCVYIFWARTTRRARQVWLVAALALTLLSGAAYLRLLDYTFVAGPESQRLAKGFEMRPEAAAAGLTLRDVEYDPERIWTHESIRRVQTYLLASWLGFFVSLSCFLALAAMLLEGRGRGRAAARPREEVDAA